MKLYVNGYKVHKIVTKDPVPGRSPDSVYNFSNKYEALKEYYERVTSLFEWDDGSKSKLSHYVKYEWRVFNNSEIVSADLINYANIENDEIDGRNIFLTVHTDNSSRTFRVLILDEKRTIETEHDFGGQDDTTNKGYEMAFVNADPIININMTNMTAYQEGIGGTSDSPHKGAVS